MRLVHVESAPDDSTEETLRERSQRFQLARVLQVTEHMLEQANAGNWEMVEELEAQRSVKLQECFAMQDDSPSDLIAEALAMLLYLNEQLVQIVRYAKDRAAADRVEQRRTFTAVSAYSEGL